MRWRWRRPLNCNCCCHRPIDWSGNDRIRAVASGSCADRERTNVFVAANQIHLLNRMDSVWSVLWAMMLRPIRLSWIGASVSLPEIRWKTQIRFLDFCIPNYYIGILEIICLFILFALWFVIYNYYRFHRHFLLYRYTFGSVFSSSTKPIYWNDAIKSSNTSSEIMTDSRKKKTNVYVR